MSSCLGVLLLRLLSCQISLAPSLEHPNGRLLQGRSFQDRLLFLAFYFNNFTNSFSCFFVLSIEYELLIILSISFFVYLPFFNNLFICSSLWHITTISLSTKPTAFASISKGASIIIFFLLIFLIIDLILLIITGCVIVFNFFNLFLSEKTIFFNSSL